MGSALGLVTNFSRLFLSQAIKTSLRFLGIRKTVSTQKIVIPLNGIPSRDEINSAIQNSHCAATAQFIAVVELLGEKGLLEASDQDFLQRRKTYWLSQFDQMLAQQKDAVLKDTLDDFRRRTKG